MRGCNVDLVQQRNVEIGLRLPDVQHHAEILPLFQTFQQRGVIDDRATTGIYQNSASLQTTDQRLVSKMERLIGPLFEEGRMEGDDVTCFNQLIQGAEVAFITVVFTRRITQQGANA